MQSTKDIKKEIITVYWEKFCDNKTINFLEVCGDIMRPSVEDISHNFRFDPMIINENQQNEVELYFDEHFDELKQRISQVLIVISIFLFLTFVEIKPIVEILQKPAQGVKFFQLSPGEYFLSTIKVACYTSLFFSIPIVVNQTIFFLMPGLNESEKKTVINLIVSSITLFIIGIFFSYFVLTPAALTFLLSYGSEVIEPLWSFDEYFSFIITLFFSTGLIFQIPIFQVLLSALNLISGDEMLNLWKYVVLCSTIISAILTPSTDPLTQLLLTGAIIFLYLLGAFAAQTLIGPRRV